jgi:hypothetical protein
MVHSSGKLKPNIVYLAREAAPPYASAQGIDWNPLYYPHTTFNRSLGDAKVVVSGGVRVVFSNSTPTSDYANRSIYFLFGAFDRPSPGDTYYESNIIQLGAAIDAFSIATVYGTGSILTGTPILDEVWTPTYFFSDFYADNYPTTVTGFQGRLVFGGTPSDPDKLWMSRLGETLNFARPLFTALNLPAPSLTEASTVAFSLSAAKGNFITGLCVLKNAILAVTDKRILAVSGQGGALSPFSVSSEKIVSKGGYYSMVVDCDEFTTIVSFDRRSIFLIKERENGLSYTTIDLSLSYGKFNSDITQISWNPAKKILTIVLDDGGSHYLTISEQTGAIAITDKLSPENDNSKLLSAAYLQLGMDLHLVEHDNGDKTLNRTSSEVSTLATTFVNEDTKDKWLSYASHIDNGYRFGGGVSSALLPDRFKNKTVSLVYAKDVGPGIDHTVDDIVVLEDVSVDSLGSLVLPEFVDLCVVGFPIKMAIATMPIEAGAQMGTAQLGLKRIDKVSAWYYRSTSFSISSDGYNSEKIELDGIDTGRKEVAFTASSEYDQKVYITHDSLGPCYIATLSMRGISNDG